jgi:serpin B
MDENAGENRLDIFNALWYEESSPISRDYLNRIGTYYGADPQVYERSKWESANARINAWVEEKTHGRISHANPSLSDQGPTALLNVIYFRSRWEIPFDKTKTKSEKFFSLEKASSPKDFMKGTNSILYFEDKDIQAVSLPYQCSSLAMIIILPKERYALESVESKLTERYTETIKKGMHHETVILSLPKFKMEGEYTLDSWLREKGILADQPEDLPFRVSNVIHKTFIEVTEEETEAAALTEIVMTGYGGGSHEPPPPKIFNANHPFMFWITDNQSMQILFMGRVVR